MAEIDWNQKVKEALDRTEFMAMSTVGEDGSWTNPVQFGYDEKLNLYFKSMPHSRHMEYLAKDPRISVAIFKTERFPDREVLGLQLAGMAQILTERENVEQACKHYYGRDPRGFDYRTKVDEHLGKSKWKFVKIAPNEAWCFDPREFGEERMEIDLAKLDIELDY
jgi:nitroimidazol reductase NimA-like FMN-containing flavoprotein (pyridoxamine 5'-phosphate oxidase superfamily)